MPSGVLGDSLKDKTICATAQQKQSIHYNMHSLYGLMEAKATSRLHTLPHTHAANKDNMLKDFHITIS